MNTNWRALAEHLGEAIVDIFMLPGTMALAAANPIIGPISGNSAVFVSVLLSTLSLAFLLAVVINVSRVSCRAITTVGSAIAAFFFGIKMKLLSETRGRGLSGRRR